MLNVAVKPNFKVFILSGLRIEPESTILFHLLLIQAMGGTFAVETLESLSRRFAHPTFGEGTVPPRQGGKRWCSFLMQVAITEVPDVYSLDILKHRSATLNCQELLYLPTKLLLKQ